MNAKYQRIVDNADFYKIGEYRGKICIVKCSQFFKQVRHIIRVTPAQLKARFLEYK